MAEVNAQVGTQQVVMGEGFVKAADYRKIYANQIQIALTPFDVQISLAQSSAVGAIGVNEIQATVFLAPGEAKALAFLLTKIVGDYERQIGPISLPPGMLQAAPEQPATT